MKRGINDKNLPRLLSWFAALPASEKRGLCSQDVRRLETPEIKYLSPCSLITLCSLGIENGFSPSLVFINFISFPNEVAFIVGQEPLLTAESDRLDRAPSKSLRIER
jgi:hypothetical protein